MLLLHRIQNSTTHYYLLGNIVCHFSLPWHEINIPYAKPRQTIVCEWGCHRNENACKLALSIINASTVNQDWQNRKIVRLLPWCEWMSILKHFQNNRKHNSILHKCQVICQLMSSISWNSSTMKYCGDYMIELMESMRWWEFNVINPKRSYGIAKRDVG